MNKSANAFIQNQYNDWFSNQIIHQLKSGNDPANIKVSSKLSDLKALHTGVTVNKYSPKKVLPDYFFTNEKVLPQYLLPSEKVLPLEKMLPYPEILAACFSQYFIGSVFSPGKIYSLRNRSIAHWNFECFNNTIHCL